MANMSYCRFQNTYLDLRECVNVMGEALDNGKTYREFLDDLSEEEQYAFKRLLTTAVDLINFNEELVEAQHQEDY